jgi:ferredoxin/thioredoxin reductase
MMVLGIPEYRLARGLISREIDAIVELGVELRAGCRVGADVTIDDLLGEHSGLLLAVGTGQGRDLDLPGYGLDGVLRAVEFLLNVNQGFRVQLGERVVVVGGGNVAFDAARTALRASSRGAQPPAPVALGPDAGADARRGVTTPFDVARAAVRAGVRSVTVIALESPAEIPAAPEEIDEAEAEGIEIVYRRGPHRFVGNGRVSGLETIAVASVFDDQGRFAPVFIPDTEQVVPADTVILAVGQTSDFGFLDVGAPDLGRTPRGGLALDQALRTSDPRVWAAGDMAFGPRNLIDAIAEGQRVAHNIHTTVTGESAPRRDVRVELSPRPGFRRLATGYDGIDRVAIPMLPTARRAGFAEVEVGYDEDSAVLEGLRCLRCFDNIMLRTELCILCGLCVDVCPYNCISIVRADRAGVGAASQSALLLDEELCIRCGLCVNRCPPGALVMAHAKEPAHG